jgi:3-oxoacyl-[acyl-carrier protein] reductase
MPQDRFDCLRIGQEAEILHIITEADVNSFVRLTGDDNPLHVSSAYAERTTMRKRVVHGMLSASFISTMIGVKLPGEGSLWYEQQLRFLKPVHIGDEIRVWARITAKSASQRIVVLDTVVFDQDGERVIEGEAKVRVLELLRDNMPEVKEKASMEEKGLIIVTGASRGIGASVARELGLAGFAVGVNYLSNREAAEGVVQDIEQAGGRAAAFQADVTDFEAVQALATQAKENFGPIHGVVNNASGTIAPVDFLHAEWIDFQKHLDVQIKASVHLIQAALPDMIEARDGVVVNIASVFADNLPPAKLAPYVTSKAALRALSRSLATDYGPKGVRVNSVSPGMTQTDLITDVPEKAKMVAKAQTPLRRLGDPEDIAGVVAFLFSDKGRFITGQDIRACGGVVMP